MPAANGIYRLSVIGTVQGQQHIHTLHFRSTVDPDALAQSEEAYQTALVTAWQTNNRTAYRALFSVSGENPCQQYAVRKVCGGTPLPAGVDVAETTPLSAGTRVTSGEPMASWLASCTTIRTGNAGRRYRGRSYIGGMWETDVWSSTLQAAILGLLETYFLGLKTAYVTPLDADNPFAWFVYSRTQSEVPGTQCQDAGADVTTYQLRNQLASMKSRKLGHGI